MAYGRRRLVDDPPERLRVRPPSVTDADRLLYSDHFRRLGGVTQVVPPDHTVVHHDRLTHSLKVAQVARGMAFYLRTRLHEDVDVAAARAGALAHDLGHAPFGHHGEAVLRVWSDELHLPGSFEGNAQTLRILAKNAIRRRRADEVPSGLNWSWRSIAASVKYPWVRAAAGYHHEKWGAYFTEEDVLNEVVGRFPAGQQSGLCLEAQLMDWADDISYAVHDVEDFFLAGLIPLHNRGEWEDFCDGADTKAKVRAEYEAKRYPMGDFEHHYEVAREGPVQYFPEFEPSRAAVTITELQNFTSQMITLLTDGVVVDEAGDLTIAPTKRVEVELLKNLTAYYVWGRSEKVRTLQRKQGDLLEEVLRYLHREVRATLNQWDPPGPNEGVSGYMPHEVGQTVLDPRLEYLVVEAIIEADAAGLDREHAYARGILDFLCSLTDAQVVQLGVDAGIIQREERDDHLYIGLAAK